RDAETGYLVKPQDPEGLAERLGHLYQNPKLLSLFGSRAVRRVHDLFTWQRVARAMIDLYEDVIEQAPRGAIEADELRVVDEAFRATTEVLKQSRRQLPTGILRVAHAITSTLGRGGKVLVCGDGESAADSQRLTGELVGRFRQAERQALPVISLTD